jgi:signal transduction histidine kinase
MNRHANTHFVAHCCLLLWSAWPAVAQPAEGPLTNAIDILSLTPEQARSGIPVTIQGVVTVAQPDWGGQFFVQDATAGIYVNNLSDHRPLPGDLVRVTGFSDPGGFAPMITWPKWEKLGNAPLPAAKPVFIDDLMTGLEDSQRVEISAAVRTARRAPFALVFQLVSGGYRFEAVAPPATVPDPLLLVGAKVRVRGTVVTTFKPQMRQMVTVYFIIPLTNDFVVESMEASNPFDQLPIPIATLAQYRREVAPGERVHVRGTVTCQRPGEDLFLQDATGGLQIKSQQLETFAPGDVIEVVGFHTYENFLPILQDAVFRKAGEAASLVPPKAVTLQELQDLFHHADLITLQGKVLERTIRRTDATTTAAAREQVTLTIQGPEFLFTAEGPTTKPGDGGELAQIPLGSVVKLNGICLLDITENGQMKTLVLLLPSVDSVSILEKPSWLTPGRLSIGLAIISAVMLLAIAWSIIESRKNATLQVVVREKETAQDELQQANEKLESRVAERTKQLKIEMSARKEAEVQFKGTLLERTRLAQELHDTLEQSLTGIALQLDASAKLFENKPDAANHHLELARDQVTQSQVEVRRSIWDLRSRALEQFDLPGALTASSHQLTEGTPIRFQVTTEGRVRPLPEIVEDNLLRIGQEAMTNVIKHSQATAAEIHLDYGPKNIVLRISDNGCGFAQNNCVGPAEGHFGLQGISERVKRLNAELTVESEPGKGTLVMVRVGLDEEHDHLDSSEL